MYRYLFLALSLIFIGCSTYTQPKVVKKVKLSSESLMATALFYELHKEPKKALDIYINLYKSSKDSFFLRQALLVKINFNLKSEELKELLKKEKKGVILARLELLYYIQNKEYKTAKSKLLKLLKTDKDYKNYELLGDLFVQEGLLYDAASNYKLAYKKSHEKNLVLKYANLLTDLKYTQKAKKILLAYERQNKPDIAISLLLSRIYKMQKDDKKLISTYEKLYKLSKNKSFIYVAVDLLSTEKQYKNALNLALKYNLDVDTKLFLYYVNKDLKSAINLSLNEYDKTKNKSYLLRAAIFKYELNPKDTKSVVSLFEQGVDEKTNAIYLNYYGYLLIEQNLDTLKGIKLVKRALLADPKNVFYIDSLAWGLYKLKKCKEAKELLDNLKPTKDFSKTKEAKEHIRKINSCVKSQERSKNDKAK